MRRDVHGCPCASVARRSRAASIPRGCPRCIARSLRQTVGYGVHRVFRLATRFLAEPGVPRTITAAGPPCGRTSARWGDLPERVGGCWLATCPPDVHSRACARKLVLEDPRSGCLLTRNAWVDATLLTFDAGFPDTCRSVGPAGCPTGLPLLGLSKDRPSVVLTTPESTPSSPLRVRLRKEPAKAPSCSAHVVFHHRDGLLLRCRARVLQRAPTLGFTSFRLRYSKLPCHTRSSPRRTSLPSEAFPPFEAATAPDSGPRERGPSPGAAAGSVTTVLPRCSPLPLPPRPFLPLPGAVAAVARACCSSSVP
jgi:hypothetical protein